MDNNIGNNLKKLKPKPLSTNESMRLWQGIVQGKQNHLSVWSLLLNNKSMAGIIAAIILVLTGSVATVHAANNSKPGDFLFPLDKAIEKIQISVSPDKQKDELKLKFAEERSREMASIIEEVKDNQEQKPERKIKMEAALEEVLDFVSNVKDDLSSDDDRKSSDRLDEIIHRLEEDLSSLPEDFELEFKYNKDNKKVKFELESEEEDRGIKIKFKSDNKNDNSNATSTATSTVNSDSKIKICHKEQGENPNSLEIYTSALDKHLSHGDHIGECNDDDDRDSKNDSDNGDDDSENKRDRKEDDDHDND